MDCVYVQSANLKETPSALTSQPVKKVMSGMLPQNHVLQQPVLQVQNTTIHVAAVRNQCSRVPQVPIGMATDVCTLPASVLKAWSGKTTAVKLLALQTVPLAVTN